MFKNAIVLTGGIATGKSTVANLFKLEGFCIIDADKIAHKILYKNNDKILSLFGKEYVQNNKVLRKNLGKLIFNNKKAKIKLEDFIHPLIKNEISNEAKIYELENKKYIIDIPLFFESNNYNIEKSIVVYAPKKVQLQRLVKRDIIDESEALNKINNQMDIESKKKLASYVIDNSKTIEHLSKEVIKIKKELMQ